MLVVKFNGVSKRLIGLSNVIIKGLVIVLNNMNHRVSKVSKQ